ncbi:MAG TPA: carboxylesterase family protein, partial [Pyrinomonadaceae bacterium]
PMPVHPWSDIKETTSFGAPCAQAILGDWNRRDSETSKEDCLYLNVITPTWKSPTPLPVMFWIHGGANAGGTASSSLYKDGTLVQHGVILVTANYRLGIFGFFSHSELTKESAHHASGNYGLLDQIAALKWIQDNIAKFGGDPKNVTVFGQSAGAQDTSLLMTSPLAKGLFHKAIVQSGSAVNPPLTPLAASEKAGAKLAEAAKAPAGQDAIPYMRQMSVTDLLKSIPPQDPTQLPLIGPNIDGWAITRSADQVFANGQQAPIPMIIGTTTREFAFAAPADQVRKFIEGVTGNFAAKALPLYGLSENGQGTTDAVYGSAGDQWFSDLVFRCPVAIQAGWQTASNQPTYQYELAHAIPGKESEGAVHSADLPYVFGFYPKSGNISGNFTQVDFKLADLIETYWTNFAKTGNPNSTGIPNWPRFDSSQTFIRFTQEGSVSPIAGGLRRPQCDMFRELLKARMAEAN